MWDEICGTWDMMGYGMWHVGHSMEHERENGQDGDNGDGECAGGDTGSGGDNVRW